MVRSDRTPLHLDSLRDATAQYNAIKSLIAKKQHQSAKQKSWHLYNQLCRDCEASEQRNCAGREAAACTQTAHLQLRGPSGDKCSKQRAVLLIGSILSLLISVVESQSPVTVADTLRALIQPLGVLPAWLRCSPSVCQQL